MISVDEGKTDTSLLHQNRHHRREFADRKRLVELQPLPAISKIAELNDLFTTVLRGGLEGVRYEGRVAMSIAEQKDPHAAQARAVTKDSELVIVAENFGEAIHHEITVGEAKCDDDEKAKNGLHRERHGHCVGRL